MLKHNGILFPFTWSQRTQGAWPGPYPPGDEIWTCDGCGEVVATIPMGGVNVQWGRLHDERDRAFEFHVRNCQKLEPMEPQRAKVAR